MSQVFMKSNSSVKVFTRLPSTRQKWFATIVRDIHIPHHVLENGKESNNVQRIGYFLQAAGAPQVVKVYRFRGAA
jgi:hypothetical protein